MKNKVPNEGQAEEEVMADPLDYERQRPPLPRTIDWGKWGAIAYLAAIAIAIIWCALVVGIVTSILND
jgi:hypothetical protein